MSELEALALEISGCQQCGLARRRTHAVPGEGASNAEVLFVGEGPGFHEDQQGRPFVGPAGQFLNDLIRAAGLRREDVFICNVVKCRPPDNRDPLPDEIEACRPYLERQVEAIDPRVIVTLGRYSLGHFLPGQAISRIHGTPFVRGKRTIFPMYHPAAALHQGSLRAVIIEDIKKLPAILADARAKSDRTSAEALATPQAPQAAQGRLF